MDATPPRNHLTSGSLLKSILYLAGPMFVSAMLQNVQSLIDLFWVGKLGSSSVAAIAMSGPVLMLVFPAAVGMATATIAFVSRYVGAGDTDTASDGAGQSLHMAFWAGLIIGLVGFAYAGYLCRLLGANEEVALLATQYLRVALLGSFTVFVLFIGNSVLQGAGNTVVPMCIMGLANLINIVLDPVFIFGLLGMPRLGVAGAALASVIAQAVAAGIVIFLLAGGVARLHVGFGRWRFRGHLAWRIVRLGIPSLAQMMTRSLMSVVLMRIVAASGMAAVAAYGIGLRFHMIILMAAFTLGSSASTLVGQNLGAGQPDRAHKAAWTAALLDMLIMIVAAIVVGVWAPRLVSFFDDSPEVISIGTDFLRTVTPFFVFVALGIVIGRALQGAGDTVSPMVLTILCLWGIQVPLALVLSRYFVPPTQGIWWGSAIAITVHGLLATAWFQTGRWKHKKV